MIGLQSGEEKIGEVVGWSRDKIQKYIILRSRIVTEVLAFAKANQKGRVTKNVTTGTKNERCVRVFRHRFWFWLKRSKKVVADASRHLAE